MKNKKIKIIALILCISIFSTGILVSAMNRKFAYDFTHYIEGRVYYGPNNKCKITLDVDSWGSDSFYIKQVEYHIFGSKTITSKTFYKKNGNKQTKTFTYVANRGYEYQFWKKQDGKRIIGTGKIEW